MEDKTANAGEGFVALFLQVLDDEWASFWTDGYPRGRSHRMRRGEWDEQGRPVLIWYRSSADGSEITIRIPR